MISRSINGWDVIYKAIDKRLSAGVVPGTKIKIRARKEVLPLLLALAADYNKTVAKLRSGECGAWVLRTARQSPKNFSDHSSGTAIDLNWNHEGAMGINGGMKTMTAEQIKACAEIKKRYEIVIWGGDAARGGDYKDSGSWDPMHFALKPNTTIADVYRVLAALKIDKNGVRKDSGTKRPNVITRVTSTIKPVIKPEPPK